MNEYIQALERVAKISAQIYKVTSLAFARTKQICCPHGNCPSYPTHAWWCDHCWLELKEALDNLESFQQGLHPTPESGGALPAVESNSENALPAVSG